MVPSEPIALCFVPDVAGEYTVTLVVNDGLLDSDPVDLNILVEAVNMPADCGHHLRSDRSGDREMVCLDGGNSEDPDGDASLLTYSWLLLSRPDGSRRRTG